MKHTERLTDAETDELLWDYVPQQVPEMNEIMEMLGGYKIAYKPVIPGIYDDKPCLTRVQVRFEDMHNADRFYDFAKVNGLVPSRIGRILQFNGKE